MAKGKEKKNYEENMKEIDSILSKFDRGEMSLDDSIQEYERAIKLIKESEKLLEQGEGKVLKVLEKNSRLETEDL